MRYQSTGAAPQTSEGTSPLQEQVVVDTWHSGHSRKFEHKVQHGEGVNGVQSSLGMKDRTPSSNAF